MFLACVVVLGLVQSGLTAAKPTTTTTPTTCKYGEKTYNLGEDFQPSPCEYCFCSTEGTVACAIMDCAVAMCVDAVNHADQCCATCPNGYNCQYNSTVIIQMGDVYHPDEDTTCRCPENPSGFGFGYGSYALQAVCTST